MIEQLEKFLTDFDITLFQHDLIQWFEQEQRDLPWRKDKNPYKVWVSEIMLQQTKVDTVIPYFKRFIEQFPTIETLANADEEKILKAWEGLGYYARVRNLQSAVKEVQAVYGGEVPNNREQFSKLKGVGPYTTGAVLSIAYDIPEPAVDGNVMRVLSRILTIWEDIAKQSTKKIFEQVIYRIIAQENPSAFNQGLMELGALICTPTGPACLLCPMQMHCRAFHDGVEKELPVKTKKKVNNHKQMIAVVLRDKEGKYFIRKRPSSGLLAKLWEFPNEEIITSHAIKQITDSLGEQYNVTIEILELFAEISHVFTHLAWNITAFCGTINHEIVDSETIKFVTEMELEQLAFPVSHQKIWKEIKKLGYFS